MSILKSLRAVSPARGRSGTPSGGLARVRPPQTGWIGVDLGTSAVKLAQVEQRNGHWRMAASAVVSNASDPSPAVPVDEAAHEQLRRMVNRGRTFRGRTAAAVLPPSMLDFRTLLLPDGSPSELRQIIAQELNDPADESAPGEGFAWWKTLAAPSAAAPVSVAVVAAPQAVVETAAESLHDAGLDCEVLDAAPFALARAAWLAAPRSGDQPQAALDWGCHSVVFTLATAGRPVFTRVFRDCGVRYLLDGVACGLGVSPAEARQILSTCGIPAAGDDPQAGRVQTAVGELTAPVLNRLAGELRRTLAYIQQHPVGAVDHIWLCGGGGLVRNMAERLASETGVPAHLWRLDATGNEGRPADPAECLFATAAALSVLRWEYAR